MDIKFADDDYERLETDASFDMHFSEAIVRSYRKKLQFLRGANSIQDVYGFKSLHCEKLKGARQGQYSIRLNDQYRLIFEIVEDKECPCLKIIHIEDYH